MWLYIFINIHAPGAERTVQTHMKCGISYGSLLFVKTPNLEFPVYKGLTLFILDTGKQVLWQTGSSLFARIKTICMYIKTS